MHTLFNSLSMYTIIGIFILSTAIVWITGIKITQITDALDNRFNMGEAFGGLILLAIVTNLPEIAIVIGGSLSHNMGIITGNILGGIAIQTVVLVLLDGLGLRSEAALTCKPISLQLVLEGLSVIFILLITILASQFPKNLIFYRIAPGDLAIVCSWLIGLGLLREAGRYLPWQKRFKEDLSKKPVKKLEHTKSIVLILFFLLLAALILIAGLSLEETSSTIASRMGWSSILFGATILAAITALPEISTGLAAIKLKDYTLAMSDIFGGNAFLPVLFMLATLLSGTSILSNLQNVDIYLASLGALLTIIYLLGLIFSSKRQFYWLGIDSVVVLLIYILGIIGLFFIKK